MNHFGSMPALAAAFTAFIERVPFYGAAILCADDPLVAELAKRATRRVITYGVLPPAELRAVELTGDGLESRFRVRRGTRELGELRLGMPGRHNVLNSLAAVAVGLEFGLPWPAIRDGLAGFGGVSRRFDIRGEHGGVILVDDYGHHPTEITAVLATARAIWPGRKLNVIFQPHRYTRTVDLAASFATAFKAADRLVLCPIYAAGETPVDGVTAAWLGEKITGGSAVEVELARDVEAAAALLRSAARPGDVWLTLGAGDVTRIAELWSPSAQAAGA
jgi:UDP-N-acetylmuramate--alanine ligase